MITNPDNKVESKNSTMTASAVKVLTPSSALFDDLDQLPPSYKTENIKSNDNIESDTKSTNFLASSSLPRSIFTSNDARRFSFNKRPVLQNKKLLRKSSQISIINNYPPQRCDSVNHDIDHSKFYMKYKGIMKDKDELPDNVINNLSFEYNYDEKIRAPRMSVVSLISSNDQQMNKFARQTSAPALLKIPSNSSSAHTLDSLAEETAPTKLNFEDNNNNNKNNLETPYIPASYDLTQQLRKFSISNYEMNINSNNVFDDNSGDYTYEIAKRKKSFVSNSSSNVSPTREKVLKIDEDLKPIKQINDPVKLLDNYVPPVLRPIQHSIFEFQKKVEKNNTNSDETDTTTTTKSTKISLNSSSDGTDDSNSLVSEDRKKNSAILTTSPSTEVDLTFFNTKSPLVSKIHNQLLNQLNIPDSESIPRPPNSMDNNLVLEERPNSILATEQNANNNNKNGKSVEPSHSHWKPNSKCSSCENCNLSFNFLKRKHHCRHCGGIYCSKCLQKYANLNILAHFEKPDDLHLMQHYIITSLIPIKSTDTVESSTTVFSTNTENTTSIKKSNSSKFRSEAAYSKYCKVCPSCYNKWLSFLASDEDYEGKNSHCHDTSDSKANNKNNRKESIGGVPNDWNWSSF